jgi:cyclophilin family peptidyl-prolyl cis-trans isomerase
MKKYISFGIFIVVLIVLSALLLRTQKGTDMNSPLSSKSTGVAGLPSSSSAVLGSNLNKSSSVLSSDIKSESTKSTSVKEPEFNPNKSYIAVLHTEKGDITISLHAKETPKTVNNFITLANKKFYDNTIFHRVIKGFMIQGGDPKGDGTGGPGYKFDDEPFTGEYVKGTVAMANAGPNTNGSQFFIMHADNPLPKNYVIFGNTISGLEVVDAIATSPVEQSSSGEPSKPVNPVHINSINIIEK